MALRLRPFAFGFLLVTMGWFVSPAIAEKQVLSEPVAASRPQGPRGVTRLREGDPVAAPFAYQLFCVRNPDDCRSSQNRQIRWDQMSRDAIGRTNRRVNAKIHPLSDDADIWQAGRSRGDCEDFALTKRRALMREGFPASALRMAVAWTKSEGLHAVLVVRTNVGDFILDSQTNDMLMPNQTDLVWIKIASGENPRLWHRL